MVRFSVTQADPSFSPSKVYCRVSCMKNSLTNRKIRNLVVSDDRRCFRPLTACCVKVEPLSSLPVEWNIRMHTNDSIDVECRIALPALPLALEDYNSPAPSLVRDNITMRSNNLVNYKVVNGCLKIPLTCISQNELFLTTFLMTVTSLPVFCNFHNWFKFCK
ncbi:unnamed protein product [Heterobilharzia americana]|nr:unnamed protein product [Heterobilharzia americana]